MKDELKKFVAESRKAVYTDMMEDRISQGITLDEAERSVEDYVNRIGATVDVFMLREAKNDIQYRLDNKLPRKTK